jgi:hypothetical protein
LPGKQQNMKKIKWVIFWYEKDGDKLIQNCDLDDVEISKLRVLYGLEFNDPMLYIYPVSALQVNYLQKFIDHEIAIDQYDYFIESLTLERSVSMPMITNRDEFAQHIDTVIRFFSEKKILGGGRKAYLDNSTGTIVITDPGDVGGGTAFRPQTRNKNPKEVFDALR